MKEVFDEELVQDEKKGIRVDNYYVTDIPERDEKGRAERARTIYAGLKTIEEKLNFIVDYGTYIRSTIDTEDFSKTEQNEQQRLLSDFITNYVDNGNFNQIRQVSEALGKLSSQVKETLLEDQKNVIATLDKDDEKRIIKAHWVSRSNEKNVGFHSSVIEVITTVSAEITSTDSATDTVFKGLNISPDDKMTDYFRKLGVDTPEMMQKTLEENGAKEHADMTVYEFYAMKHMQNFPGSPKPTKDAVMSSVKEKAVPLRCGIWRIKADQKNIKNKKYSDEEMKLYEYSSLKFNESIPTSGIKDWIKSTGQKMADDLGKNAKKEIADQFRDKYILPYEAKLSGFEIVEDSVKFNGEFTKDDIQLNIIGIMMPLADLFGDRAETARTKTVELAAEMQKLSTKTTKGPVREADLYEFGTKLKKYTDFIKTENNLLPEGSYRRKVIDMTLKHIDMYVRGDFKLIENANGDRTIRPYMSTFNNFPVSQCVSKRNEQGEPTEVVNDPVRYEEFMAKHKFYEQFAEKQRYISEVQLPYIKAKQAGKIDLKAEKDYKKATYDHLLKEKEYFREINQIKYDEVKDFHPFSGRKDALTMDWAGVRYGKKREKAINREIEALEHGWSPDDLPLIHSVDGFMKTIEDARKRNDISKAKYDQFKRMHDTFVSSYIDEKIDRRRLIAGVRPLYQEYKRLEPNDLKHFAANYDKQKNVEVSITQLNPEEVLRNNLIHALSEAYAGFSQQHSFSLRKHQDSDEMDELKRKTLEALNALSNNRDKSINDIVVRYDDPDVLGGDPVKVTVVDVLNEISRSAKNYRDAKIEEFKNENKEKVADEIEKQADKSWAETINKYVSPADQQRIKTEFENNNPDNPDQNTATYRANRKDMLRTNMLKVITDKKIRDKVIRDTKIRVSGMEKQKQEKYVEKLHQWRPGSKMGQVRYESADKLMGIVDHAVNEMNVMKSIKSHEHDVIREIREAGYDVISSKELEYHARYPYEKGVNQILNYYGTKPAFIPEHCAMPGERKKMFSKELFLEKCKPVDVKGISSEDFALVAFSVAMDCNNITPEEYKKHNMYHDDFISHKDMVYSNRTMYTLDMGMEDPRAGMANNFFGYTVVPFKEKAKEAIEAYQNGDKTKLVNIMATGIKEISEEASHTHAMSYPNGGNFSYLAGLLSKTMEFVKKDKELFNSVANKIGREGMESVNDTLRLKGFMDEAYDAKQKLETAVRDHKPLSEEEKKSCVNAIVRETLITKFHNNTRVKQVDDSPVHKQATEEMQQNYMNIATNGLSFDEIQTKLDITDYNLRRPLPQITTRLRTRDGMERLNNTVSKYASKIKSSVSEKTLLKSLDKLEKAIDQKYEKDRKAELKRQADAQRQAEANQKKTGTKKVVNP